MFKDGAKYEFDVKNTKVNAVSAMFGCTVSFLQKGTDVVFPNSEGTFEKLKAGETYIVVASEGIGEKIPQRARQLEVETRQAEKERSKSPVSARHDMLALFRSFDTNASGDIDLSEFKSLITKLGSKLTDVEAEEIFSQLDTDHNNVIDFKEFYTWWVEPKATPLHKRFADVVGSFFSGGRSYKHT